MAEAGARGLGQRTASDVATRGARRSWPMAVRVFATIVLTVFAGIWAFGTAFTVYQDRTTALTVAPLWAESVRAALALPSGTRASTRVDIPVEVMGGAPPESAVELTGDARLAAVAKVLAASGLVVQQTRLDDSVEPPITWLRVDRGEGVSRWVGIVGSLQPSDFRRRLTLGLSALVGIVVVVTALVSRWVAAPVSRLVGQLAEVARGDVPTTRVRGAREIERLGDALRDMAARRRADDERLRTMLLGVSHDLRSPLSRIRVAAELLDAPASAPSPERAALGRLRELVVRNVEQADAIIESFLAYLRAEQEGVDEAVDLARIARVAGELAGLPAERVHADAAAPMRGNAVQLQRLVANLVDNAERHGAGPIEISVAVDAVARTATLAVDDAGRGINDAERLRRPFERGDAARSTQGAGLGLAIVDRIAERHGGEVAIGRSPAGGARVAVRLPLAAA